MTVHLNKPSGEPRPGARALCGADDRHGVATTYALARVNCDECKNIERGGLAMPGTSTRCALRPYGKTDDRALRALRVYDGD